MSLLDPPARPTEPWRMQVMAIVLMMGFGAIVARLWYLQIVQGESSLRMAEDNQSKLVRRLPPRGLVVDRYGRTLATNRMRIAVSVDPSEAVKRPQALALLAKLLSTTVAELRQAIADGRTTAYDPVRVAVDVDMATATSIEEHRLDLPGVTIGPEPVRTYPDGALMGHLLGQMGPVRDTDTVKMAQDGYRKGDYCGKLGIEGSQYDHYLRGQDGGQTIQVDAKGRMRRVLGTTEPVPGATLRLTVDRALQRVAYEALQDKLRDGHPGAAVAIDPRDGSVLALVSTPSIDPNLFVTPMTREAWQTLLDDPKLPLINRAVGQATAPGSTFKIVSGAAGLETGRTSQYGSTFCAGSIRLGRWRKRCHKLSGHGYVDFSDAIAYSCDVFFYRLGQRLGPETMAEWARKFGLGEKTGIDLPSVESAGAVPTPAWKVAKRRGPWVGGDTVDYAIGQSMLACTPLQMCNVTAAIANGGTLFRPRLVSSMVVYSEGGHTETRRIAPAVLKTVPLSPRTLDIVRSSLRRVMQPRGTAARSAIPGVAVAGKTGTSQRRRRGDIVNSAWFVGYAPAEAPRIAVCVFVEDGGHGGEVAAPVARKMIASYLGVALPSGPVVESSTD